MCKVFLVLNVTPETTHANFRLKKKLFFSFDIESTCVWKLYQKKNKMKANKLCKSGLVVGEWLPKKNSISLCMSRHSRSIACHARSSSLLLQQLFVHNFFFLSNLFVYIFSGGREIDLWPLPVEFFFSFSLYKMKHVSSSALSKSFIWVLYCW